MDYLLTFRLFCLQYKFYRQKGLYIVNIRATLAAAADENGGYLFVAASTAGA
jgi:hypothetical protein